MIRIWTVLKEGKPNDMFLCCENTRLWIYLWAQFWVCTNIKWITNQDNFTLLTFKKWKSFFCSTHPQDQLDIFFHPHHCIAWLDPVVSGSVLAWWQVSFCQRQTGASTHAFKKCVCSFLHSSEMKEWWRSRRGRWVWSVPPILPISS